MDCSICCEKINKSNRKFIVCSFCPEKDNFTPCLTCVKRYLLETTQNAHCMNCKHEWSRVELYSKIPKVFLNNEYKIRRQELMVERQRSLMPATQPYVEVELDKKEAIKMEVERNLLHTNQQNINSYSNDFLEIEIKKVIKTHEIKCLLYTIRKKENKLTKKQTQVHFIRQCPMNGCRGFLSTGWKCGLCKTRVCSKCHEPKLDIEGTEDETIEVVEEEVVEPIPMEEEHKEPVVPIEEVRMEAVETIRRNRHVCDPNNVETANLLKKDTKACPKCASMIFKISGCDQMFCTQCHTAFSWRTGSIETKVIHNPHYYQYLREQSADGEIPRNPLDNPCAEILPDGQAFNDQMMRYIDIKLRDLPIFLEEETEKLIRIQLKIRAEILLCNHVVAYHFHEDHTIQDNLDLRIKYMLNDITEDYLKQQLYIREKKLEKDREFEMIFRTYVTAARDIILNFVNLSERSEMILHQKTVCLELENLRRYINECFQSLLPIFNNTVFKIVEKRDLLNLVRITKVNT